MKAFTRWLVSKVIRDYRETNNVVVRGRYGSLEAWTSIVANVILFVVKGLLGLSISSVSLIADAIHTLSDTGTSIIILLGFRIAKRPADKEHPFGHGRMEYIAALIVAVLLVVTGIELLKSSGGRIVQPSVQLGQVGTLVFLILVGTILVKELLARFARELGRMIGSNALAADFWHHRSDAFSTLFVLVAMVFSHYGYGYLDGIAGIAVALVIIYSGYKIASDAISPLLGEPPSDEFLGRIESIALRCDGVEGVHDLIVHRYGQVNLVSLHIEVADNRPIGWLHDLSERVEEAIANELGGSAVVHIDPLNRGHQRYNEIERTIAELTRKTPQIAGFHDLRIVGGSDRLKAVFDINMAEAMPAKQIAEIKWRLFGELSEQLPGVRFAIKAEPPYAYSR